MEKNEEDEVICETFMVKRSQNKKYFTPVNYKERWLVLTRRALVYYDNANEKRKERGRIETEAIHTVEQAELGELGKQVPEGDGDSPLFRYPFQVGYTERGTDYTLYLVAGSNAERVQWINSIRSVCISNGRARARYHPAAWSRSWSCCDAERRAAPGCALAAVWAPDDDLPKENHTTNLPPVTAAVTMPGGGGAPPGTPSAKLKEKQKKVVVALYPFKAIESGDLSLEKGAEYEVIDDSQEHWWKVKDENGAVGFIPSNYVKEKETLGLQKYEWYVGEMSRQRAESLLKQEDKEGCFVVRNSSTKGMYTLSLYTKVNHAQTKHYHIKQNSRGDFYLSDKHCCASIPELINYHKHNSGGLCSRLKATPCDRPAPPTAGLSHDKWEIDPSELVLLEELGAGQFGVVRRGKWRGRIDTAVKMMKEGTMSEDDFIEEAKVMTKLQHQNLVQLYGVCSKRRPIYIVTEYMRHGSLFNYLRRTAPDLLPAAVLLDMCIQVCKGMAYLERHNYIHRDLAARNCLVGDENVVKVADFGLARYVLDDQYTSSGGTKFPIKWAPPEVLNYTRFSSKSDVWAFGVLMWEVFTCGQVPYGRMKNTQVVEMVQRGHLLEKPDGCSPVIYNVMRACWRGVPDERPSFRALNAELAGVAQAVLAD
ncbi:tyrosine-protein kinase Btk29A isoform X8 [Leguminivora glycinivorella]|uniref:tyrosine-protein kinase Btk29A isoform X8 n=1 Tax=Leguminivora glycinivorella TaxID=1035111 RepID=UPI00200EA412|nr:tyrosine-protein kinase Btk29A isoform X8 [Leguminivora glycinivorella]